MKIFVCGSDGDEDRLKLYMSLQEIYRRSHSVRRIPLKFTTGGSRDSQVGGHMTLFGLLGDVFTSLVDKYLRRGLHKGMHSLFMSIRNLYSDPAKVSVCACVCACVRACVCKCKCSTGTDNRGPSHRLRSISSR